MNPLLILNAVVTKFIFQGQIVISYIIVQKILDMMSVTFLMAKSNIK